ncbi:flagellar basal body L-ring protein FlgH [Rheinheimera sp. MM224]|uniref:flagellar basal body L-ring protein FlgH n=1 Tax=Rheinheimera sp. MM224 TaxID=3019969 RepID=UPI0021F837F9|nr:flagellar basal body L-ring protein FlgH [Rheinheimera sp. MM224]CAI3806193.1 Flagellar L-ring protein [Rheinheimera sp. MM224]
MLRFLLVFVLFSLTACSSKPDSPLADDADWERGAANPMVSQQAEPASEGSLYADSYMFTLFEDKRAYRVGDILTVELNERTQSSKSADSAIDRSTDINMGVPLLGNANVSDLAMQLRNGQNYEGESSASQQNFLRGAITVRVTEVLPNGSLTIRGEKWIKLNQGDEYIRLQGIVRPDDIDVTNRISSQRIADARITYAGKGSMADAAEPGWITKLFSSYLNLF